MKITASNAFIRFKKKAKKQLQEEIDSQVKEILKTPEIGELKKADLRGIRVHKFNFQKQLYLLSYEVVNDNLLQLYLIGPHENFYQKLKNILY